MCVDESEFCGSEIRKLGGYARRIDGLIGSYKTDDKNDRLLPTLTEFQKFAKPKVESLAKDYDGLLKRVESLAEYYGEPSKKTKWETLFSVFSDFSDMYSRAEKDLARMKLDAEKELQRKNREEKRRQARASKPNLGLDSDSTGRAVDGVFDALKGAGSKQIMEQLRARRAGGAQKPQLPVGDFRSVLRKTKR